MKWSVPEFLAAPKTVALTLVFVNMKLSGHLKISPEMSRFWIKHRIIKIGWRNKNSVLTIYVFQNVCRLLFKSFIRGIKHDFICINICWAPREVLKPEPERWGFQHLPRGTVDVNVSENHVWLLLLHKNIWSLKNFGNKALKNSFFLHL